MILHLTGRVIALPTLANYLGVKQPSAAIGKPLAEVLGN